MINKEEYLSGNKVWGDDFTEEEIKAWFKDEESGYYNLCSSSGSVKLNNSDKENKIHSYYGYPYIEKRKFQTAMGLGSADGREFKPIIKNIKDLTIVEAAEEFFHDFNTGEGHAKYVKPDVMGKLDFPDEYFDFIMASSVLYHIPNVSYVFGELTRCLSSGGILIVSEPIVNMGGLEGKRPGLTLRERGIPISFFEEQVKHYEYNVLLKKTFNHAVTRKIISPICKKGLSDSKFVLRIDDFLCNYLALKTKYHTTNIIQKLFQAADIYLVLEKQ